MYTQKRREAKKEGREKTIQFLLGMVYWCSVTLKSSYVQLNTSFAVFLDFSDYALRNSQGLLIE